MSEFIGVLKTITIADIAITLIENIPYILIGVLIYYICHSRR